MTFDSVKGLGEWKPIRDCPGRFVLHGVPPTYSITDLFGESVSIQQFQSPRARDVVCVVCLDDGGMISYHRSSGTWLHTLNTKEGFRRKLDQLKISLYQSVT
jgi:hypothetical protein